MWWSQFRLLPNKTWKNTCVLQQRLDMIFSNANGHCVTQNVWFTFISLSTNLTALQPFTVHWRLNGNSWSAFFLVQRRISALVPKERTPCRCVHFCFQSNSCYSKYRFHLGSIILVTHYLIIIWWIKLWPTAFICFKLQLILKHFFN